MDSWQLKQILKLYIYFVVKTTSSVKLFDKKVTIQKFQNGRNDFIAHVFVYKWVFTFFRKKEKKDSRNLSHVWNFFIENERALKMNAHFEKEPHFENESIFLEKWKAINPFLKKLQLANSIKKDSRMFVGSKFNWLISSNPEFFPSES